MRRRDFIKSTAVAGISTKMIGDSWDQPKNFNSFIERNTSWRTHQDNTDRGPDRDPLEIQKSTLVVSGLDVSTLNEKYIGMLKKGGVDCWHKSMAGVDSYAAVYNFCDAHNADIAVATTAGEIEKLHRERKP